MRRNSKLHSCCMLQDHFILEKDNGTCVMLAILWNYFKGFSPVYLLGFSMQTLHYKKFFYFLKVFSLSSLLSYQNIEQDFAVLKSSSTGSRQNQWRGDMDPLICKKKLGCIK